MKKLIPAISMLLVAACLLGSSTFAWFSMNTTVTATGMQVKAKSEGGIVIAPYTQSSASKASDSGSAGYNDILTDAVLAAPEATAYKDTATMSLTAAALFPTSTQTAADWYHAKSNDVNNYAAVAGSYATLTAANLMTDGKYYTGNGSDAGNQYAYQGQYFLYNKFSVKATDEGTYSLWVSEISVSGETNSAALNDSMRIAIKVGDGAVACFAPMYASDDPSTLYFYNGTARTAGSPAKGNTPNVKVANNKINTTASDIQVWVYYEGEDENCKTINAVNIDTLNITLTFTVVDPT